MNVSISSNHLNPNFCYNDNLYYALYTENSKYIVRKVTYNKLKKYSNKDFVAMRMIYELLLDLYQFKIKMCIDIIYYDRQTLLNYLDFYLTSKQKEYFKINVLNYETKYSIKAAELCKMYTKKSKNTFEILDLYCDDFVEDYGFIDDDFLDI